jgi:hypothetical protein
MDTGSLAAESAEVLADKLKLEPAPRQILEQLDRITGSSHFRNSKRYPALLRYIVGEALAGRGEALKERTLGSCVFGRSSDYDTNLDPVVRISAGEVRKRIAQYYQSPGHEHEIRIEIPLGSYMSRFHHPLKNGWEGVAAPAQPFPAARQQEEEVREDDQQEPPVALHPIVSSAPLASKASKATRD